MSRYIFVRRTLRLNRDKKSFYVIKDSLYEVFGHTHEQALDNLITSIDATEGTEGVLMNNGIPLHLSSEREKAGYLAGIILCGITDNKKEQIAALDEDRMQYLLPGFYGDIELTTPRMLVTYRIRIQGDQVDQVDQVDYLFYPDGGSYKGELERYFYFNGNIYAAEGLSPKWCFELERILVQPLANEEPYYFTGKLLAFFQGPRKGAPNYPCYLIKIFKTDGGDYLLYVHIDQEDGTPDPRTILRSASKGMIYSRLRYHLEQVYSRAEFENQWSEIERYLTEVTDVLKISSGSK